MIKPWKKSIFFFSEGRKMVHSVAVLQNSQNANLFTFRECFMKWNSSVPKMQHFASFWKKKTPHSNFYIFFLRLLKCKVLSVSIIRTTFLLPFMGYFCWISNVFSQDLESLSMNLRSSSMQWSLLHIKNTYHAHEYT
jgi:hypothetical protein